MPLSKEHILTLLKTPKIGPASVKSINRFANFKITSINDLFDVIVDAKKENPRIPLPEKENLLEANSRAQMILEDCNNKGIIPISINEDLYPIKLMRLDDFPVMVYVKGAISAVNSQYSAGVIGTREPSPYGIKAGRRISNILARHGFSIISGLAIGCDTVGHLGALDAQGPTVAVLAGGLDTIYPKENKYLADKIVEQGGALFSEYEVGFKPQRSSFVERDRLQTGLSNGLVVIETDMQGGTMHAVKTAQLLNVPLGCVSGHPEYLQDYPKTRGTKYLIEGGAAALGNIEQIFSFIQKLNPNIIEFIPEDKSKVENNNISVSSTFNISIPITKAVQTPVENDNLLTNSVQNENEMIPTSFEQLVEKVSELSNLMRRMADQQDLMAKMIAQITEQSNIKEKVSKQKRLKTEINHPKLL